MRIQNNKFIKSLIAIIAIINIVLMMGFEYKLPGEGKKDHLELEETQNQTETEETQVGTIESVEREEADKEAQAAETALAKHESEEEEEEERDPDAPILELTDEHIYLEVGERFNYMSYIKTMEDVDGSDLSHYIYLDQDVDTSEPGEIYLTYRITSTITGKSDSKVLHITVQ